MKKTGQILILALLFGACSTTEENKDGTEQASADTAMESSTEDSLFAEDSGSENSQPQEDLFVSSEEDSGGGENSISVNSASGEYVVESGDTLMLIAFKIYGDYSRWKEISSMNPGVSSKKLSRGQVLKFSPPSEKFVWNPKGEPYLIKNGDTLGTISNDKYGTAAKWKILFENNRPMIKDPNLIFAGFTLYYQADGREVASSL